MLDKDLTRLNELSARVNGLLDIFETHQTWLVNVSRRLANQHIEWQKVVVPAIRHHANGRMIAESGKEIWGTVGELGECITATGENSTELIKALLEVIDELKRLP